MTYTKPEVVTLASAMRAIESFEKPVLALQDANYPIDQRPMSPAYEADE